MYEPSITVRPGETHPDEPSSALTKREHFAALLLQGSMHHPSSDGRDFSDIANEAVQGADALINALNKEAK